jgi:hypothetical protein
MWQRLLNHFQSRTLAHIHTCSINPAIVGSTGGRLLLESFRVRPSHLICLFMVVKRVPLRSIFRVGNSQKSLRARSGEYGGRVITGMLFSARNCCTTTSVWLGALSHWATRCLLCSNSSARKAFLSSPDHRTLWISLQVTFGCSLL